MKAKEKSRYPEKYEPKDAKVKITTYIDGDVILALKDKAASEGTKYQPYINEILRRWVESENMLNAPSMIEKAHRFFSQFKSIDEIDDFLVKATVDEKPSQKKHNKKPA